MRYILDQLGGPIEYGRYAAYLATIRERLPENVYEFASNASNFDLSSHSSLHDAWLESFSIIEPAEGERNELRRVDIKSSYLGPFHDKRILINYIDVIGYSVQTPPTVHLPPSPLNGHGDLITHEIRLEDEIMLHELIFSRGSTFQIYFTRFEHVIQNAEHAAQE